MTHLPRIHPRRHLCLVALVLAVLALASACGGSGGSTGGGSDGNAAGTPDEMAKAMAAGDCARANRIGKQIIADASESDNALMMAHIVLFNCATLSGDTAAAKAHTAALRTLPDDTGIASGMALYLDAVAAYQSGDSDTASLLGRRAIADAKKHDIPTISAMASVLMAGLFDDAGDCAAASQAAKQALVLVDQSDSESLTGQLAQLIGGGQPGSTARQRSEARAHMLLGSCATDKAIALRESEQAVKIAKDVGEELLLLETTARQADTAVLFDDCATALAAGNEAAGLGDSFPVTVTGRFRVQVYGAKISCAPLQEAVKAGDEALGLVTPLRNAEPSLELSILQVYAGTLFSHAKYKQGCALISDHPEALAEDELLNSPAFVNYRILAAECPLFTPKNKAKLQDGIAIGTDAIASLKTSTDKSTLGLAYYVRGLLYANLGDTPAARADLEKAAQLGNQDAIDVLNGG